MANDLDALFLDEFPLGRSAWILVLFPLECDFLERGLVPRPYVFLLVMLICTIHCIPARASPFFVFSLVD